MQTSSALWTVAFKRRLGADLAPPGAVCKLKRSAADNDDGDDGPRECGMPLGRRAAHACTGPRSATRLRVHTAAAHGLADELRRAGACVDLERRVPELYQTNDDGSIREAVMDLVVGFPATAQRWWLDINIRTPFAAHLSNAGHIPGAAAALGDKRKAERYGAEVFSVAVESGGRLSLSAADALRSIVSAAALYGRKHASGSRGTTVRRLASRLTTLVMLWSADATLAALGTAQ